MITITKEHLFAISPYTNKSFVDDLVVAFNRYLNSYNINTLDRLVYFIGQGAEESDGFKTMREYASGNEYEGRRDLGNIMAGDGPRFKGRGIFELTGRSNYVNEGAKLGLDLVNHPELAEIPDVAVQTACLYWNNHNLSGLADQSGGVLNENVLEGITRKINGGLNGLDSRRIYTQRAYHVFSPLFSMKQTVPTPIKVTPVVAPVVENTAPALQAMVSQATPQSPNIFQSFGDWISRMFN